MILNPVSGLPNGPCETNLTASARSGTTITASGTTHTKGSYATIIATTGAPRFGVYIKVKEVGVSGALHNFLLDLAVGDSPSGGNEVIVIPDLGCGNAPTGAGGGPLGKTFFFPIFIPGGVSIRGRAQANTASKTGVVAVHLGQKVFLPWRGGQVSAYGVDAANSRGTSVTPGSGAFGTWTQMGTTTSRRHRFWTLAVDALASTTTSDAHLLVQVGTGPDSSNVTAFWQCLVGESAGETFGGPLPTHGYYPLPAGEKVWVQIASGATTARGVIVYGID